jgi:hypothetical protein
MKWESRGNLSTGLKTLIDPQRRRACSDDKQEQDDQGKQNRPKIFLRKDFFQPGRQLFLYSLSKLYQPAHSSLHIMKKRPAKNTGQSIGIKEIIFQ